MYNLIKKILQTSGANIYSMLLGIITLSITARWLGAEGRGIVASVTTWVNLFVDIAGLSLGTAVIYQATHKTGKNWLGTTLGNMIFLVIVMTLVSWLIITLIYIAGNYWGLPNLLNNIPLFALVLGFLILPVWFWEEYNRSLLNIEDHLHLFNRYEIIGSSSNAIAQLILVVGSGLGVAGVLISKFIWQSTIAFGGLKFLVKQAGSTIRVDFPEMRKLVIDGLKLHLNTIGVIMMMSMDVIMVTAYLGVEATGYYQLASQLVQMMLIVSYAAATVLQGEVTRRGIYGVWNYQKKILLMATALVLVGIVVAGWSAKWWLILLAGEEFYPAIELFQYLSIMVVAVTFTNILSVQWIARGLLWQMSAITIVKGIMNIGLNALLIPKYGLLGAVYSTLGVVFFGMIINIIMFIYFEYDTRRHFKNLASNDSHPHA
ncbi:MAG: Unknown protein [uncultured Thiotrichaceae bacterium]|uniref:Uncharacterized protein n=1 Tax=uncultured Thiotrichaceae bacterium TaxID=298394 RepID=A0A6S6SNZ7_9GAMM|nr:MAG: Unknown protein [uncultured Thiotrichaceae bacterium]